MVFLLKNKLFVYPMEFRGMFDRVATLILLGDI